MSGRVHPVVRNRAARGRPRNIVTLYQARDKFKRWAKSVRNARERRQTALALIRHSGANVAVDRPRVRLHVFGSRRRGDAIMNNREDYTTWLKYRGANVFGLDSGATINSSGNCWDYQCFNVNSCYDPDASFGGHQPRYYDQIKQFYTYARVLRFSLRVWLWAPCCFETYLSYPDVNKQTAALAGTGWLEPAYNEAWWKLSEDRKVGRYKFHGPMVVGNCGGYGSNTAWGVGQIIPAYLGDLQDGPVPQRETGSAGGPADVRKIHYGNKLHKMFKITYDEYLRDNQYACPTGAVYAEANPALGMGCWLSARNMAWYCSQNIPYKFQLKFQVRFEKRIGVPGS